MCLSDLFEGMLVRLTMFGLPLAIYFTLMIKHRSTGWVRPRPFPLGDQPFVYPLADFQMPLNAFIFGHAIMIIRPGYRTSSQIIGEADKVHT